MSSYRLIAGLVLVCCALGLGYRDAQQKRFDSTTYAICMLVGTVGVYRLVEATTSRRI